MFPRSIVILPLIDRGLACSTVNLKGSGLQVPGRNYDWSIGGALLMVNEWGCDKCRVIRPGEKNLKATWNARYGSITFNDCGRELPTGGMRGAGVVVQAAALAETRHPLQDERPYAGSALQGRQYLLDTCATAAEVIAAETASFVTTGRVTDTAFSSPGDQEANKNADPTHPFHTQDELAAGWNVLQRHAVAWLLRRGELLPS